MTLEETIKELEKAAWADGYWLDRPFMKWQAELFLTFLRELEEYRAAEGDKKKEAVNHPEHYQSKHECIDVMRAMFGDEAVMGFCRCNAYKYRFRAAAKNGEEDIKKADWYEEYLMKMEGEKHD